MSKTPPRNFLERCYKNDQGDIALVQWPNLLLWSWLSCQVLLHFTTNVTSTMHILLTTLAFGVLFAWAWLEITTGTSYFRRALGLLILISTVVSKLH